MATGFFSQQDLARRNTRILISLFSVAVLLLIILTNLLVMFSLGYLTPDDSQHYTPAALSWEVVSWTSLIVLGAVGIAVSVKWLQLRQGGQAVAKALGGQIVSAATTDPALRRLLNITEEMALAANVPVPPVYLLPEQGINAFAAGYSPADAVIGVTKGCIEQLNRDELQGVIAHEFSHILNGDMRMNIRMIAILNGILFLGHIGYLLMRSGSAGRHRRSSGNNKNNGVAAILLLALGLVVIGYLGSFFGNLIKAAVSRQREFLADASAVQFTRNPSGIAGALKRIAVYHDGSRIENQQADEISHMFFSQAISRWAAIFATHPPLAERIRRIEPNWNGKYPEQQTSQQSAETKNTTANHAADRQKVISAILPLVLLESSHHQQSAQAVVLATLLPQDSELSATLLSQLQQQAPELEAQIRQFGPQITQLPLPEKVRLLQRCIPALKELAQPQFVQFEQWLQVFIQADGKTDLLEWVAASFVEHTVAVQFRQQQIVSRTSASSLKQIQPQLLQLLAALANSAVTSRQLQVWQQGLTALQLTEPLPLPATDYAMLSEAVTRLMASAPALKASLWKIILSAIAANGKPAAEQQALLQAISLLLEIPYIAES
ncbi:M48 family metallopeptidase [Chromatiaceae bacterium AAb-1]|nr:M48 family metallopeptidase [Chromatiaceae bacterium AAb-1]